MKQQTAVEWLVKIYLQTNKIDSFDIEQAKEMETNQIIKAFNKGAMQPQRMGTDYFDETYGSKGSDALKNGGGVFISEGGVLKSSQTEISDEEMIQAAIKHSEIYTLKFIPRSSFIDGAKWYREKTKKQ